jgi:hypothetical protein
MSTEEKLSFDDYLEISKQNAVKEVDNLIDLPKPNGIYHKLHLAKQEIGKVTKGSNNPFFKSKYADLNAILEATEPILLKYGLILLQPILDGSVCTQIIDIESGNKIESILKLPDITDPQKLIASITYYRRGSLQSLLSMQAVDLDGNDVAETIRNQKPTISKERFENGLVKIQNGVNKKEDMFKYELSDVQKAALSLM